MGASEPPPDVLLPDEQDTVTLLPPGGTSSNAENVDSSLEQHVVTIPAQERSPDGRPLLPRAFSKISREANNVKQVVIENVRPLVDVVKETATKEGAQRVARSTWEGLQNDWRVAAHHSHDMLVLWMCTPGFKALPLEEQQNHWIILWNPIYWAMYLPLLGMIISGKWLHALWGQGGMMRPDETIEETRIRIHWIYCLDGPIAFACGLDLLDVMFDVPNYTQKKFTAGALSWCMTLIVTGVYILANSYFLDVVRRRSLVGVRLLIVYQTVFGFGLLNMLVAGAMRNKMSHKNGEYIFGSWPAFFAWSIRLIMTLFMLCAAFVYSRLWNAYRKERQLAEEVSFHKHGSYLRKECRQYAALPIAALVIWALLILASYLGEDIFWDALV